MRTYFALRRIWTRPASADSVRVAPPTMTFPALVIRYSRQSAAVFSSDSSRVTTTISSTQPQRFSAVSVLASTGIPERSIKSLSSPIRVEAPAATTTTLHEVFFAWRRKSENRLIGFIHSVFSVSQTLIQLDFRKVIRTIHGKRYLREKDLARLIEHPALAGG